MNEANSVAKKIICALDFPGLHPMELCARKLYSHVGMLKVGLELISRYGVELTLDRLPGGISTKLGGPGVMLDLKLSDIPNTVRGAIRTLDYVPDGIVKLITVHASAGPATMAAAVEEAAKYGAEIAAVTVLTSIKEEHTLEVFGQELDEAVIGLASLAVREGATHIVCSPREVEELRKPMYSLLIPPHIKFITPGIRPLWAQKADQARTMTPSEALKAGSDYIVIGRPITQSEKFTPSQAVACIAGQAEEELRHD